MGHDFISPLILRRYDRTVAKSSAADSHIDWPNTLDYILLFRLMKLRYSWEVYV